MKAPNIAHFICTKPEMCMSDHGIFLGPIAYYPLFKNHEWPYYNIYFLKQIVKLFFSKYFNNYINESSLTLFRNSLYILTASNLPFNRLLV